MSCARRDACDLASTRREIARELDLQASHDGLHGVQLDSIDICRWRRDGLRQSRRAVSRAMPWSQRDRLANEAVTALLFLTCLGRSMATTAADTKPEIARQIALPFEVLAKPSRDVCGCCWRRCSTLLQCIANFAQCIQRNHHPFRPPRPRNVFRGHCLTLLMPARQAIDDCLAKIREVSIQPCLDGLTRQQHAAGNQSAHCWLGDSDQISKVLLRAWRFQVKYFACA